jgi:PAS domain S-box-containing protein
MKSISVQLGTTENQSRVRHARDWNVPFDSPTVVAGLVVFVGYYLGAKLGFALTFRPHPVSVLWPPNSILAAALLLTPLRIWWLLLLVAFPAHWAAQLQNHIPPTMILCWFISNSCEALIGAGLLRYLIGGPLRFGSLRNAGMFCLCVVLAGPFLSSFLDSAFVRWNHWGQGGYWELFRIRFTSNVLAALTVTPLIVTWATSGMGALRKARLWRCLEAGVLFLGLLSVIFIVLYKIGPDGDSALLYLPLPFLLWAAVRFGSCGASTAVATVALLTIWSAAHGHGPFSGGSAEQSALSVQMFLIVMSVPLMFLAAVIEEREKGETGLRESEERMSLAADAAGLIVWTWDIPRDEVSLSDKDRAFFGFSQSEKLNSERVRSVVHLEDRQFVRQLVEDSLHTREEIEAEYRVVLPDGKVRWVARRGRVEFDGNGEPTCERGVLMDITERKQAEEKFRLATEASPSGILLVNDQGRMVLVNSQIEKLFGYRREELVGKPVDILVPERFASQHPNHRATFFAAPTARAMGAGRELFARRKDGSEFPVEIGLNPIQTAEGILVLAAVVDISARKVAEEEALRHREDLGHLSRVAVMGELTASIAHELNQPLSGIISNASAGQRFIDRGDVDLRELHDLLADIVADGRRAGDVIRGIQSMVRKGTPARQRVNLNELVTNVLRMLNQNAMLRSCELQTLLDPNLPAIEGDPIQLQQVLINLVINSLDAMRNTPPSRRKVVVTTERNGDNTICTSVRDYGVGIPEEARDRIFDHFFTTKADGLGMGLGIVRSIVESHAGTVVAENVDGGGARFHFTLPISPEGAATLPLS